MIREPPAAPITSLASPVGITMTAGHIEDSGRLPGTIKFAGDGGMPKMLVIFGEEKSSISSLKMIPVSSPRRLEPNL